MTFHHCSNCSLYSPRHHACFHPDAWKEGPEFPNGFGFLEPGNPDIINANYDCPWYDTERPREIQPDGLRRFWRDIKRPWRIRITK